MKKKRRNKLDKKLYILAVRNKQGQVTDLLSSYDYSNLMLEGMELAKEKTGSWSIFRMFKPGIEIDGGTLTAPFKEIKND
jgi:hypothetical protein